MDQLDATPVAGTEGGISPFLSPDDRWIGFWNRQAGKLEKIPVSGGVPVPLCDLGITFGADWGSDNSIVFCPDKGLGLSRISGEGGKPEVLTVPDKSRGEIGHHLPHVLPDGKGVLFTIAENWYDDRHRLALLDLKTRKWHVVMEDAADGRYIRTGHLIFLRRGSLMAAPFDLSRLEPSGQPVPVVVHIEQALNTLSGSWNTGAGQYSVSDSGWLAYVSGGIFPDNENYFVRLDMNGNIHPVADLKAPFVAVRFSPDGQRLAFNTAGEKWLIGIYDLARGATTQLTSDGLAGGVRWLPDGKRLVFGWLKSGQANLYWQPWDGSSPMERLTTGEYGQEPGSFTPDGSTLAFVESRPETGNDIFLLDIKSRKTRPFLNSKANEAYPEFSPDGRWLAYASNESGRWEVWVRPFPGPGGRWQISKEGGTEPIWSRDRKQLFYRLVHQVWAVDIRTEEGFSVGKLHFLFERPGFFRSQPTRSWDLYPDGQGFLMVQVATKPLQPMREMVLVQNWSEELKRLVPTGKK